MTPDLLFLRDIACQPRSFPASAGCQTDVIVEKKQVVNTVFDKCPACGSTDNDGWLLETVIDYETNLVSSREVPCPSCEKRKAVPPAPVAEPIPDHKPAPAQVSMRAGQEPVRIAAQADESESVPGPRAQPASEHADALVS